MSTGPTTAEPTVAAPRCQTLRTGWAKTTAYASAAATKAGEAVDSTAGRVTRFVLGMLALAAAIVLHYFGMNMPRLSAILIPACAVVGATLLTTLVAFKKPGVITATDSPALAAPITTAAKPKAGWIC